MHYAIYTFAAVRFNGDSYRISVTIVCYISNGIIYTYWQQTDVTVMFAHNYNYRVVKRNLYIYQFLLPFTPMFSSTMNIVIYNSKVFFSFKSVLNSHGLPTNLLCQWHLHLTLVLKVSSDLELRAVCNDNVRNRLSMLPITVK